MVGRKETESNWALGSRSSILRVLGAGCGAKGSAGRTEGRRGKKPFRHRKPCRTLGFGCGGLMGFPKLRQDEMPSRRAEWRCLLSDGRRERSTSCPAPPPPSIIRVPMETGVPISGPPPQLCSGGKAGAFLSFTGVGSLEVGLEGWCSSRPEHFPTGAKIKTLLIPSGEGPQPGDYGWVTFWALRAHAAEEHMGVHLFFQCFILDANTAPAWRKSSANT